MEDPIKSQPVRRVSRNSKVLLACLRQLLPERSFLQASAVCLTIFRRCSGPAWTQCAYACVVEALQGRRISLYLVLSIFSSGE